jgi:hypothetical protein
MAAPGYGARKGAAFERTLAVLLSMWITSDERDDVLWRTAMSGGRSTIGRRVGKARDAQAGDLGAIDSEAEWFCNTFLIEAKCYKAFKWDRDAYDPWTALPRKATMRPLEIALHTIEEARESNREAPLVFLKANAQPVVVLTTSRGIELLEGGGDAVNPTLSWPAHDVYAFRLDSFIPRADFPAIQSNWTS